jgi:predicted alpha/beta superfamily hydrolase
MHDGQNVFDNLTSFAGEWEVDETLNALHAGGDTGIIVVAIDNGQNLRIEEYTPWSNTTYGGGDGGIYVSFLINELKPFIDSHYRTLPDRENTGIMGSSLGGLISTYAGIEHQDVFGKVGVFSPAYWINPEVFDHVSATGKEENMRIYQIAGTLEGADFIDQMFAMEDTIHAAGFGMHEVITLEKPDGQHSEWFWAREFESAYRWLFERFPTGTRELAADGIVPRLYPIPSRDLLILEFNLTEPDEVSVEILDTIGALNKLIYENRLNSGGHQLNLNSAQWSLTPGSYLCRLHIGEESVSMKFIIVN